MAEVIGYLSEAQGAVEVKTADGINKVVSRGDAIHQGDVIQTGSASTATVTLNGGRELQFVENSKVLMDETVTREEAYSQNEIQPNPEQIELLDLLEQDGDLSELDPTAEGTEGGDSLKDVVTTEYNIEGNPTDDFIQMVLEIKPTQVTLVPDGPDAITSNAGWDCINQKDYLSPIISQFKNAGIRVSVFLDPVVEQVDAALACGTDRIEL